MFISTLLSYIDDFIAIMSSTFFDIVPILLIILGFQFFVLKKAIPNFKKVAVGFVFVLLGLTFFLHGLEQTLFPIGRLMAEQLNDPMFLFGKPHLADDFVVHWQDYYWVYIFSFSIGFATAIAEPALLAVAIKAEQVSAGTLTTIGLRVAVALGAATGLSLGTFRIVTGLPIHWFIIAGYIIIVILTLYSSKNIVPLAYDSGGVTTSTVTVPLVAALGLGLAESVPGRSALLDGFGLIAFTCLFPIIFVMVYAKLIEIKRFKIKRR